MTEQQEPVALATAGQEQIWFFDQAVEGATFHTVPVYVDITGPLDSPALADAVTAVVHRHEPLRTRYAARDIGLVAQTVSGVRVPIRFDDLREHPAAERSARAESLIRDELARRIDVGSDLPLRVTLLRLDDELHRLVLLIHHIAVDGASVAVLQDELLRCYQAAVDGREPHLPEPAVRYRELAERSREGGQARSLPWWQEELADLPDRLELPNMHNRPDRPDYSADSFPLVVPQALADKVRKLARDTYSSPFMVLLAAFSVLLHRVTGARDLVIGTPSAGREHAESHELIGYFINMLALRVRLPWDPTLRDATSVTRDTVLTALDHRETPFHQVVRALRPDRELDRHPIFQFVFACPPPLAGPSRAGGCTFTFTQGTSSQGLYDVEVQLPDGGSGEIRGWLKFRTALYHRADLQDLADRFLLVLEQLTGSPQDRLSNVSLLRPAERTWSVRELNANATAYPANATLVELFEEVAGRFSAEIAVQYGTEQLRYGELDRAANQLAHHLISRGVSVGTPVGVLLERGVDWIIAALAVLKAGGAYLPLDPEYPPERLVTLCADSAVSVIVADRELPGLTRVDPADRSDRMDPPRQPLLPDDLAYVMYTSGSTGNPKGVCVSHRNVVRLVRDTNYVEFQPGDRVAQTSTTTFDAATFEIWGALLSGARLVGLPTDVALDPARLGQWLRDNEIHTMFLTTSVAMHVAREVPGALSTLRYFLFGGEQPDTTAVATLAAHPGGPEHLVNGYGPTETTTFAAAHRCNGVSATDGRIPLGRALSNTQLYVLDGYLEPVPPGVTGELCIGGDGVGHGYVARPELTAERFVPDHLGGRPGARLYRTGDLARLLPDGTIEYLGRLDRQVKIRGFRIEPGEVEACLHSSGLVRAAVVVPRRDGPEGTRLVGYVVPQHRGEDPIDALMQHLRAKLPGYLVPAALVALPSFPLTRNGKLDLRALPEPETPGDEPAADAAPRTPTELRLAEVWQAVLGTDRIGRDTNFFDLGGHSLKAARLVSRIASELQVEVPLRLLFDHPTIAALAAEVERLPAAGAASVGATPIRAGARSALSVADLIEGLDP